MLEGQGFRARAHDLVGVAAASMQLAVAPGAMVDTAGLLPRASRRSSAGVDANRQSPARPVNPRLSGYAWVQNFNNGNQNNNDKGVDFVGQVIRPHRITGRAKTHRAALRRVATTPADSLTDTVNSYLGLYRHAGSRSQSIAICRLAARCGLRLDRDLTKVMKKGRKHA